MANLKHIGAYTKYKYGADAVRGGVGISYIKVSDRERRVPFVHALVGGDQRWMRCILITDCDRIRTMPTAINFTRDVRALVTAARACRAHREIDFRSVYEAPELSVRVCVLYGY